MCGKHFSFVLTAPAFIFCPTCLLWNNNTHTDVYVLYTVYIPNTYVLEGVSFEKYWKLNLNIYSMINDQAPHFWMSYFIWYLYISFTFVFTKRDWVIENVKLDNSSKNQFFFAKCKLQWKYKFWTQVEMRGAQIVNLGSLQNGLR